MQQLQINAIDINQRYFSISDLYQMYKQSKLIINLPQHSKFDFCYGESSRIIESILVGIPINNIYFTFDIKTQTYTVVDGCKRLQSIFNYMSDMYVLQELNFLPHLVNHKYYNLSRNYKEDLCTFCLSCLVCIDIHEDTTNKVVELLKTKL